MRLGCHEMMPHTTWSLLAQALADELEYTVLSLSTERKQDMNSKCNRRHFKFPRVRTLPSQEASISAMSSASLSARMSPSESVRDSECERGNDDVRRSVLGARTASAAAAPPGPEPVPPL